MDRRVPERWVWWTAGVVALLAGWLLIPSAVRASCGHYVVYKSQPAGEAAEANPQVPPAGLPSVPQPCTGPNCSRAPIVPPSAPLPTPPDNGEQWGCLTLLSATVQLGPSAN